MFWFPSTKRDILRFDFYKPCKRFSPLRPWCPLLSRSRLFFFFGHLLPLFKDLKSSYLIVWLLGLVELNFRTPDFLLTKIKIKLGKWSLVCQQRRYQPSAVCLPLSSAFLLSTMIWKLAAEFKMWCERDNVKSIQFLHFAFSFWMNDHRRLVLFALIHPNFESVKWIKTFLFSKAPSWTCAISDWTKSLKTEGWSRCSGDNSLMNGLRRGENGGLEDFVDQLEGAWCCSPPSQYRHIGLRCVTNRYIENW